MPFPYPFPIIFGVWPTAAVVIADEIQDIIKGSLLVELRIEERSLAGFSIEDMAEALSFSKGQEVRIFDTNDDPIFGGVIDSVETVRAAPAGGLIHHIWCADYHYFADKRLVAASYENKTCGFIFDDIYDNYLAAEGIGIGNIELGAVLVEAVFNYVRVTDAFDALAEKAGKIWWIDEFKDIFFQNRDTTPAAWSATTVDMIKGSPRLIGGNPKYRNRQYIRGGKGTTLVLTEEFVADGKQNAFTCSFPLAKIPTSIKEDGGAAKTLGIRGLDAPGDFEYYWNKGSPTVYATTDPGAGVVVEVIYYGQYDILVMAQDDAQIIDRQTVEGTGTGIVETIDDEPKLDESQAVVDAAKSKLSKFATAGKALYYQTLRTSLFPGVLQSIDYPLLDMAPDDMLIEAVAISNFSLGELLYDIIAVQGPESGSWTEYFKALAGMKQEVIDRLNIGSEQILIILATFEGNVEVSEAITYIETACPFPAATLFPEATLFPC